jgi:hypothetical protein
MPLTGSLSLGGVEDGSVKHKEQRSFADVMREARAAPQRPQPPAAAAGLTDAVGRRWREVEESISESRAQALVRDGAELAWDDCGSLGYGTPVRWISRAEAADLAAHGPPTLRVNKRHAAGLSSWRTEDGSWLVLATQSVRWGDRLA